MVKKPRRFLPAVSICSLFFMALSGGAAGPRAESLAAGDTMFFRYTFPAPTIEMENGLARVRMEGILNEGRPGEPLLPLQTARLLIPAGRAVRLITVTPEGETALEGCYLVEHAEEDVPLSRPDLARPTSRNESVYGSDEVFPASAGQLVTVQRKHGYDVAMVTLSPVRYQPLSGRLWHAPALNVRVVLEPRRGPRPLGASRPAKRQPGDAESVMALVDNPGELASYAADDSGPVALETNTNFPSGSFGHVIISSDALLRAPAPFNFQALSANRTRYGLLSTNVSVEWIYANYSSGDNPTKIRNFIRDAYNQWGVRYVLLGGGATVVPPRKLWVEAGPGSAYVTEMPADLYYSCLDGSFNSDGDGRWGEPTDGADKGYGDDDVDLLAEVYVGRAPVSTVSDVANFVRKTLLYTQGGDYFSRISMAGEHLGFGGVSEYATAMMEQIRIGGNYDGYFTYGFRNGPDARDYNTQRRLYDSPTNTWTKAQIVNLINEGVHVVNHMGHANAKHNLKLDVGDLSRLQNSEPCFIYSQGCDAGWFDQPDCFAESIVKMQAGAFAVIMNARYGWGSQNSTDGPSQRFNRRFWDNVLGTNNVYQLGAANAASKEQNIAVMAMRPVMRWCMYEINLFGEPSLGFANKTPLAVINTDRQAYQSSAVMSVSVVDMNNADDSAPILLQCYSGSVSLVENGTALRTNDATLISETVITLHRTARLSVLTNMADVAALLSPPPAHGQTLALTYVDTTAGGPQPQNVYALLPVDDVPPTISGVTVSRVTDSSMEVRWLTDEAANSYALATPYLPPHPETQLTGSSVYQPTNAAGLASHVVVVDGLEPKTRHYAAVVSSDPAGNTASFPSNLASSNPSDYVGLATQLRRYGLLDYMELGVGGWTSDGIENCWEWGVPGFGPSAAYSGSKCWGTRLNGLYDNVMNAWLASPIVKVGRSPRIQFATWYDIEDGFDYGFVEVNGGRGWENVTPLGFPGRAAVTGLSGGWRRVTIDLPASFENRNIQVRFRLQTDYIVRRAGWYVDDVEISHVSEPGIWVVSPVFPVDDSPAISVANNGNGWPEPGETFDLRLQTYSSDVVPRSNVIARLDCGANGVRLLAGAAAVAYGDFSVGDARTGTPVRVSLTNDEAILTGRVTLFHSARDNAGGLWEDEVLLDVRRRAAVSGVVTDLAGVPIGGAIVQASAPGEPVVSAMTTASGAYILPGLAEGVAYEIVASKPGSYSPSEPRMAIAPASGVDFGLGRAIATIIPDSFELTLRQTGGTNFVIWIANTNALADRALRVRLQSEVETPGVTVTFATGTNTISVPPGGMTGVVVRIAADAVDAQDADGAIRLFLNDVYAPVHVIPFSVAIKPGPVLAEWMAFFDDADGDGYIEPGEAVDVYLTAWNDGNDTAFDVTGRLVFAGTSGATVTAPDLLFGNVVTNTVGTNSPPARFVVDGGATNGMVLPFVAELFDRDGAAWVFAFEAEVRKVRTIGGAVRDAVTSLPVIGARVHAWGEGGSWAADTDAMGYYAIHGLADGIYTVAVVEAQGYGAAPIQVVPVSGADVSGVDFDLPPYLVDYGPPAFSLTLQEGRETNGLVSVTNNGPAAVGIRLRGAMVEGELLALGTVPQAPAVDWERLTAEQADLRTIMVRFRDGASPAQMEAACKAAGVKLLHHLRRRPIGLVAVPETLTLNDAAQRLAARPEVLFTEPNYRGRIAQAPKYLPNDPYYAAGYLWGLNNEGELGGTVGEDIDAPEAWYLTRGSSNVVVAVVDTGIAYNHGDLAGNMWRNPDEIPFNGIDDDGNGIVDDYYGANFVNLEFYLPGNPMDDEGHGTHVAGTIGAVGNNGMGISGVAWNVRLMALKAGDLYGNIYYYAAVAATDYAIQKGAHIINNSWGGYQWSSLLHELFLEAAASNILVVCAAGNNGRNNDLVPFYPASDPAPNVVSVAAADADGILANFSNYGASTVDLTAPGVDIYSTAAGFTPEGAYRFMDGSSMASPHVAGVAALIKAFAPDATWDMMKAALLQGVRKDPRLDGKVASGGHLNALRALQKIGAYWMAFAPRDLNVPPSGAVTSKVTFNDGGLLPAGMYVADIVLESGVNQNRIPVTLQVTPAPVPQIASVRVDDGVSGDGDGVAEPGETVSLYITLYNRGSSLLPAANGTLSTTNAGVSFADASLAWPLIPSGVSLESGDPATLTVPAGASNIALRLTVQAPGYAPWTNLWFQLETVVKHSATGRVTDVASGLGVAGATVEAYGMAGAGSTVTDGHGYYRLNGLTDGRLTLRARKAGYGPSEWTNVVLAGGNAVVNMAIGAPAGATVPTNLVFTVFAGDVAATNVAFTNTGNAAWTVRAYEMPAGRVALLSDANQLDGVAPIVRGLGLSCDVLNNNLTYGYSLAAGVLTEYDLVIADLTGADGFGRRLTEDEADAMAEYLAYGGRLLLTGRNVTARPDNGALAEMVGSRFVGLQRMASERATVSATNDPFLNGPWCVMEPGDTLMVAPQVYDNAQADLEVGAWTILTVGAGSKVMRRNVGSGQAIYWSGNANGGDWTSPGPLQDLFKNAVYALLGGEVPWMNVGVPASLVVAAGGGDSSPTIQVDTLGGVLEDGTNRAAVLLVGNLPNGPDRVLPVSLRAVPPALTALSSTGVKRWNNTWLQGDGSATSCLFQVIYAGPDGVPAPPTAEGGASGDDVLLLGLPDGLPYGRFGQGYEGQIDFGKFRRAFQHQLQAGARIYVRAWDSRTFADAVAYGDSPLYTLQRAMGERRDFGTWVVSNAPGYPSESLSGLRDYNGDAIPDGWCIRFGLDPRDPVVALTPTLRYLTKVGSYGSGSSQFNNPGRVAVSSNAVYVADTKNHRIQIWNRNLTIRLGSFGSFGGGTNQLRGPQGIALDPVRGRLIVADSGNYRVMILNLVSSNGLAFYKQFGTNGVANGQFNTAFGVAVSPVDGMIVVADSLDSGACNHRVQLFTAEGVYLSKFGTYGSANGQFDRPLGVAMDEGGRIYVADSGNHRVQCFNGAGAYLWKTGTSGTGLGQFNRPRDVQVWAGGHLVVTDTGNHRIQVADIASAPPASWRGAYGSYGTADGQFNFPQGASPAPDEAVVFVADTWNHRIQKVRLLVDGDGDGMDDIWEAMNGLNPRYAADAWEDPDGDGVLNIGEYRLNTNPHNADSDDDDMPDGYELAAGYRPWLSDAPRGYFRLRDFDVLRSLPADFGLQWRAETGGVYLIEMRDSLLTGAWTNSGVTVTSAVQGEIVWTNLPLGTNNTRFFRLRWLNP